MNVAIAKKLITSVKTHTNGGNSNGIFSFWIKQINMYDESRRSKQMNSQANEWTVDLMNRDVQSRWTIKADEHYLGIHSFDILIRFELRGVLSASTRRQSLPFESMKEKAGRLDTNKPLSLLYTKSGWDISSWSYPALHPKSK